MSDNIVDFISSKKILEEIKEFLNNEDFIILHNNIFNKYFEKELIKIIELNIKKLYSLVEEDSDLFHERAHIKVKGFTNKLFRKLIFVLCVLDICGVVGGPAIRRYFTKEICPLKNIFENQNIYNSIFPRWLLFFLQKFINVGIESKLNSDHWSCVNLYMTIHESIITLDSPAINFIIFIDRIHVLIDILDRKSRGWA